MPTKLSVFCDKVIEAGWLTAIIVVPLFFNVYSSRVFEPDKLTLLRSIALVMAVAWVIKVVEKGLASNSQSPVPNSQPRSTFWGQVSQTPLVLPTLALVAVYVLSTVFSITPRVSLWGSYQRLQGTYTTFSYIVIFFLALEGLRRREQLDRLVTVVILVSLPISLYGLMQHNQLDPLPWGGNVAARVASNMGNSIFVSAYLIMAIPLTLARLVGSSLTILEDKSFWDKAIFLLVFAIFVGAQLYAATLYVWGGLLVVLIFFIPLFGFSIYLEKPFSRLVPIGCYSGVLTTQLICTYFSKSRGPMLGLLGGLYFFGLLFAVWKRSKKGAFVAVGSAMAIALFLVVFNLSDALAPLRNQPYIGRLGRVLDPEETTAKVRILIWEGVLKLVPPHEPLEFPSGEPDRWNFLRPFLGYGPESMYVAYNRFYPPDLAHVEARNASPDRSHNETFDALVITGLVGFVAYMTLFSSLFYYGLKWLGLITTPRERNVFLSLWLGFGALVTAGFWRMLGANFVGVALPFGMVIGLGTYLAIYTFFFYRGETREEGTPYQLLLIALLSALVAHFIEIHFGIAIAATRTYFWVYAALMVVIGYYLRRETVSAPPKTMEPAEPPKEQRRTRRRKKRQAAPAPKPQPMVGALPGPATAMMPYALLTGIVMVTMVFDYRTAHLPITAKNYSVFWLFFITWLFSGVIITFELLNYRARWHPALQRDMTNWSLAFLLYFVVSLGCLFAFHFIHIGQLSIQANVASVAEVMKQADRVANTLTIYYLCLFFLVLALATALVREVTLPAQTWRITNWWLYPILIVGLTWLILTTNLNVIKADIYYKQGQAYDNKQSRDAAIELYKKALTLAPNEDFYYLFLGRAYLERAQATEDAAQKAALLDEGLKVLQKARKLNPLNTDHSANLARYYRTRGAMAGDPADKEKFLNQALEYYRQATSLSPHNAQLFNEWGLVYFMRGDYDQALEKYRQSLALDQEFEQTYLQLGDLYMAKKELDKAAEAYSKAVDLNPKQVQAHSALSYIYSQQGKLDLAVEENLKVLELKPNDYASHKNLAILYQQLGRLDEAIAEAETALELAPKNERASLESFIAQLKGLPPKPVEGSQPSSSDRELIQTYLSQGQELLQKGDLDQAAEVYSQALALDPNLVQAHSALGYIYAQQGRLPEAVEENLAVLRLAPNDYASHKNLAILYQQLGRIDEALAEAQIALSLAPENEKAAVEAFIAQLQQQASP